MQVSSNGQSSFVEQPTAICPGVGNTNGGSGVVGTYISGREGIPTGNGNWESMEIGKILSGILEVVADMGAIGAISSVVIATHPYKGLPLVPGGQLQTGR
jgi:hypothetical protein